MAAGSSKALGQAAQVLPAGQVQREAVPCRLEIQILAAGARFIAWPASQAGRVGYKSLVWELAMTA